MAIQQFDEPGLGFLVFEFDFVADQSHHAAGGAVVGWTDGQPDFGAFRAANQLDDLAKSMSTTSTGGVIALRDGHNVVALLESFAFFRRTAVNELIHLAITIVLAELRADAEKRQVHADGKILRVLGVEVIRMGIVGMRQRVEVGLQYVRAVPVGCHVQIPAVVPLQRVGDFRRGGFGQGQNHGAVGLAKFRG